MAGDTKDEYGSLPSWNIVVICTVGGILFFEHICHELNHAAHGKKHASELLEGVYRELAILGIVAFVLWSISVSEYSTIEYNDKVLFEEIHMTLFLAAIFHSFFVGLVAFYSRNINRRWDIFEDDETRRYKDLKQEHRRTAQILGIRHSSLKRGIGFWRKLWLSIRHPIHSRRLSALSEHVSYHALRSQFIKDNQLPKNFRFAAYLQKCEQDVVIELAGIKHSIWVGLILGVGIELFAKGLMGEAESNKDAKVLFLVIAAFVAISALVVHFKVLDIYNTLVRSYTASTDRNEGMMQFLGGDVASSTRHQDLFWFGKPSVLLTTIQSMQFLLAIMVGALIWFGTGESTGLVIVGEAILAVGALAVYGFVLPRFIPKYTKITHVGSMVNRHILSETLKKQKANFKRRALPPTLRQVSVMARIKANESEENKVIAWLRKIMSGHGFREFILVIISIQFFLVAYNVDPVEARDDTDTVWIAEMIVAGIAVAVEIMTHLLVWRGKAYFTCNPFLTVEDAAILAANTPNASAVVYPSISKRNLLDNNGEPASDLADMEKGGMDNSMVEKKALPVEPPISINNNEPGVVTRCSIWACFGWTGGSMGGGICFGVPPQAAVGVYRTMDLLLILVVTGCAVATGLVEGNTREIVHAIQGIVILRMLPLFKCPLPPAEGHDDLHDIDGAKVHHAPLDEGSREHVMEETLRLLRGQSAPEGTFAARALTSENALDDGMDDMQNAISNQPDDVVDLMKKQGTIQEEKDDDIDRDDLDPDREIANVGVAIALREACAAHPELVQSHGPLSAPILRAMLGLDPYKTARQDNTQALAVAAKAVALARGLNHSDAIERDPSAATEAGAGGVGALRVRRQSSAAAPPSSIAADSSSSMSELSSSEEEGGEPRRDRSNSGVRTRLHSFLGGGGGGRQQQREQQQLAYQQQQEMQFRIQLQQQQQQLQQFQFQQYQQRQQQEAALMGGGVAATPPFNLAASTLGSSWLFQSGASNAGLEPGQDALMTPSGLAFGGGNGTGMPVTGVSSWHYPQDSSRIQRGRDMSSGNQSWAGGFGAPGNRSMSVGMKKPSSVKSSRSQKPRGRSRTTRRAGSSAKSESGVMAAAVEDIERPVLPSIASSTGSQHGPLPRGSTPHGGGRVPYSSSHSVPFSSGHRARALSRGTPARGTRQPPGRIAAAVAEESAAVSREVGVASSGSRAAGGGGSGGRRELLEAESGVTEATVSSSSGASVTPHPEKPSDKRE